MKGKQGSFELEREEDCMGETMQSGMDSDKELDHAAKD